MLNEKFWLAIAFFTFAALIIKYVGPIITKALDKKSKQIAEDILMAKELKEKAQKLLENAEKYFAESMNFAEKLKKDAEIEVKQFAEESQKNLEAEINTRTNAALQRIKIEEESAVREIKVSIISKAVEGLSTGLTKGLDQKNHEILISKAASDFAKIIH